MVFTVVAFPMASRRTPLTLVAALAALLFFTPTSFASGQPSFAPGQTVDVFTLPYYGTTGLTIAIASSDGSYATSVPLTYVGQITGDYTPNFAIQAGVDWGTTWAEYRFSVPSGGPSGSYSGVITLPNGSAAFTRVVGYPDPTGAYGTFFTYTSNPPGGQLPELPHAALLPLIGVSGWMLLWRRGRARRA